MAKLEDLRARSLIPACDVALDRYEQIVRETADLPEVGAYKVSAMLGLAHGLGAVVDVARRHTSKPLIYDHQKAGTDIPDTGRGFMETVAEAGVDAVILFPFAGPTTQKAWIQAAQEAHLDVIVGAHMTHANFADNDGGYISTRSIEKIFRLAANVGVKHFVVPGNNAEAITAIRGFVAADISEPIFYAPGFVAQGGEISAAGAAAGPRWHAIVGRAIYEAADIRVAVENLSRSLN
jgi:orotidine-5'-phosphate decarboxylase